MHAPVDSNEEHRNIEREEKSAGRMQSGRYRFERYVTFGAVLSLCLALSVFILTLLAGCAQQGRSMPLTVSAAPGNGEHRIEVAGR